MGILYRPGANYLNDPFPMQKVQIAPLAGRPKFVSSLQHPTLWSAGEPATQTQHSQYQSITDQFESWNQELMNLPTRSCYVKVHEKPAVKITSLKVKDPRIDQRELADVLGEYRNRYQRSEQEAEDVLKKEEDRQVFSRNTPVHEESNDAAADSHILFRNPFKEKK
jgi:hypothetical protein